MTPDQIDALSQADVTQAREHIAAYRAAGSRDGVSTLDFVLSQVNGTTHTLDAAKAYLHRVMVTPT